MRAIKDRGTALPFVVCTAPNWGREISKDEVVGKLGVLTGIDTAHARRSKAPDTSFMTAKQVLIDIANRLSEDATLADAAYELELRTAILEGMPVEEVERMLPKWISR